MSEKTERFTLATSTQTMETIERLCTQRGVSKTKLITDAITMYADLVERSVNGKLDVTFRYADGDKLALLVLY